jgi:multidrug transporter EmrE-like cation transporter
MPRSIIILIFAIVFNALANILIKVGMVRVKETTGVIALIGQAVKQPALIAGVCSFALALACYSVVLTRLNLSIAYPIMVSMGLILVVLASFFLLKETITPLQIAGFLFIIAGVWMVAR